MLSERRERLHHAAGKALESLYAGRTSEVQDRLAYHYSRAGEPATAILHLDRLAADNLERHAHEEAAAAVRQALEHAERLAPEQRAAVRLDLTIRLVDSLYFLGELAEGERLLAELAPGSTAPDPRAEAPLPLLARPYAEPSRRPRRRPGGGRARPPRRPAGGRPHPRPLPVRARPRGVVVRAVRRGPRARPRGDAAPRAGGRPLVAGALPLLRRPQPPLPRPGGRRAPGGGPGGRARRGGRRSPPQELRRLEPRHVPGDARRRRGCGAAMRARPRALAGPCEHRLGRGHARVRARPVRAPRAAVEMLQGCLQAIRRTRHRRVECWFAGWLAEAHLLAGDPSGRAPSPAGRCARPSASACPGPPPAR